ncbi:hypothetical protein RHGRI_015746 [Rhododendron griersonianum]|uniref:Uncharacterized protein n=1 Tax=Rhododendron griersonianum TaxID=479676 RepID=A0AAV6JRD8_9ERIC|nr:hypothetical protein RHGRI_015746 [Rhododendron griersonianum]
MAAALSNSSVIKNHSPLHLSPGYAFKPMDQYIGSSAPNNLSFRSIQIGKRQISTSRRALTVQAGYRDGGRSGNSTLFVGGFLLGGIIFGTLGCVYAPQISKALLGPERMELMKKLPKFKYDEEKALEVSC